MWFLRWKWVAFHFLGNLATIVICGTIIALLFPGFVHPPENVIDILSLFLPCIAVTLAITVFIGYWSSKNIRDQLEEIGLGARNLAYGNLQYRLKLSGNLEIDEIIEAFNNMAERLEAQVKALQKLAEENEQLLREAQITAVSEERQRLARDLHDAVSQQLFAISMMASTVSKICEAQPNKAATLIQEIQQSASKAQSEMRALLLQLRPLTLQNKSLAEALDALARELESKQQIRCTIDLDSIVMGKNIENQLYRIAQEALSNILRHAEAEQVRISLKTSKEGHRLLFTVEDDGRGFSPHNIPPSSFGIRSIKERSTLLGGTAQWITVPGQGTRLEIRVPLSTELDPKE